MVLKASRKSIINSFDNEYLTIFLYSFPNFAEAIVGTFVVCGIMLYSKAKVKFLFHFPSNATYLIATLLAAVYVILQEMKIHNLGGENIYDPYDIAFSIIGLFTAYLILLLIKPERYEREDHDTSS
jgi:uncharacterized membrane protein YuzA (DUF378 family)